MLDTILSFALVLSKQKASSRLAPCHCSSVRSRPHHDASSQAVEHAVTLPKSYLLVLSGRAHTLLDLPTTSGSGKSRPVQRHPLEQRPFLRPPPHISLCLIPGPLNILIRTSPRRLDEGISRLLHLEVGQRHWLWVSEGGGVVGKRTQEAAMPGVLVPPRSVTPDDQIRCGQCKHRKSRHEFTKGDRILKSCLPCRLSKEKSNSAQPRKTSRRMKQKSAAIIASRPSGQAPCTSHHKCLRCIATISQSIRSLSSRTAPSESGRSSPGPHLHLAYSIPERLLLRNSMSVQF